MLAPTSRKESAAWANTSCDDVAAYTQMAAARMAVFSRTEEYSNISGASAERFVGDHRFEHVAITPVVVVVVGLLLSTSPSSRSKSPE